MGSRKRSAIALTDGLLARPRPRELAGVLAHEVGHIANGGPRVMSLADPVSRLTSRFALVGQVMLIVLLPGWIAGAGGLPWLGLLVLAVSPHLAMPVQPGPSRVGERDADRAAARLTGDPEGLASALARIDRGSRSRRAWLLPGRGNPAPSWLRTRPETAERIRRLLAPSLPEPTDDWPAPVLVSRPAAPIDGLPRWYPGGFWR